MPSRSLVWNLMFRAKTSRRCLRISSARTNPGYRLLFYRILIQSPHQINLKQGIKNQSFAIARLFIAAWNNLAICFWQTLITITV
ncbi:TPA: hypothetical protein ACJ5DT_003055 [Legionella pneumophila]|uniref:hypothetical protein n=1 Tax=Legionella pneumophila TaxID=446 RepID=UPI000770AD99|nr:hypothetical protein [Legionella pneumophila]AUB69242.1 hypothetical protein BJK09_10515 [Legionella pneumophila]AUB72215.1 hypothetical protein BJK08_10510 [Legionella pneumophila]KXB25466.1 hypothetical protein PtVF66_08175 [Legionella pneumophila]KZX35580.1 hypothetical protein PtVFX2014_14375 [Legionella pneumophila]CZG57660.1 Uncharacterised protein [Legionella pneumophila]